MDGKEEIREMIMDSYKQGGIDICDSIIEVLETVIDAGADEFLTLPTMVNIIKESKKTVCEAKESTCKI